MRTLLCVISHPKMLLLAGGFAFLEVAILPNPLLIFVLAGAMLVDFLTGLLKSWEAKKATTSSGFRKSVVKVTVYCSAITAIWLAAVLLTAMYPGMNYTKLVDWMISVLSLIELYSVFENIYSMAPNSKLSRWIAKPILKKLKGVIDEADKDLNASDDENTPSN